MKRKTVRKRLRGVMRRLGYSRRNRRHNMRVYRKRMK